MDLPTKLDGKRLRQVAGAFPTGVTIITIEKENSGIHGMTASSFQSVSLDPALISFCVKESATIFPLLEVGKIVGVSILDASQKHISNQFAGMNKEDIEIPMTKKEMGAWVIEHALAWYSTTIHQIIPAGDHFLILCEIKDLGRVEGSTPLVYWSGYRTVGENI